MRQIGRYVFLLSVALLSWTGAAQAQDEVPDSTRIDVRVESVAGGNAYLDAGTERKIMTGDTLDVWREGVQLGQFRVVS